MKNIEKNFGNLEENDCKTFLTKLKQDKRLQKSIAIALAPYYISGAVAGVGYLCGDLPLEGTLIIPSISTFILPWFIAIAKHYYEGGRSGFF